MILVPFNGLDTCLSTALQHSIQNVFFLSFQIWISGNIWPQCTVMFTSLLFSLLCNNLRVC